MPTPQHGQYLMHVHNHYITRQWQPWTAVSPLLGLISMAWPQDNKPAYQRPFTAKASAKPPLSSSWLGTATAIKQLSHSMRMEMGSEKLTCVPPKILKQSNVTLHRILATFVMEQKLHVHTTR